MQIRIVITFMIIFLAINATHGLRAGKPPQMTKKERIAYDNKVKKNLSTWNKMFGEKVNFSFKRRSSFFYRMIIAGVWSLNEFEDTSGGIKRTKTLKASCDNWAKVFFNKKYRPHIEPTKYCIKKNGGYSTLYYRWKAEEYQFTMFETMAGVLLEITPKEGDPLRPTPDEFKELIEKIINTQPVKNAWNEELTVKPFKLTRKIKEGDVLTNAKGGFYEKTVNGLQRVKNQNTQEPGSILSFGNRDDWRSNIVVFASKHGICITLIKIRDIGEPQQGWGTRLDPRDWVSNGLIFPKKTKK